MKSKLNKYVSRRDMLKLIGAGTAGLIVTACTPKATEAPVAATSEPDEPEVVGDAPSVSNLEEGHLTCLLCCGTDETHELQERFNQYFTETYPSITTSLELTPAGQNYFEKLQTLMAAGTPPDVFDMWEGYIQPYAANGALMNFSPYIDTDPEWTADDFQPAAVSAGSWNGDIYSIIRDFYPGPAMFFYNKDLFDAAGIEYPTFDWDWNKMREASMELTQDTTGDGNVNQWGVMFETWFVVWLHWIWSNGGDLFNEDETKCALTDPKAYESLQFFSDLINVDGCAIPSSELAAMQGAQNAFNTGAVAMFYGYSWSINDMKAARDQGLNWGCLLPPKANTGGRAFYMHLESWAAAKETKIPNACWQYIRDFTELYTAEFVSYYPGIPFLKDDIDLFLTEENVSYGWDKIPEVISDPKNIRIPGAGAKFDKISGIVQAELDLVFTGDKTAQAAVETAAPQVDEELARDS